MTISLMILVPLYISSRALVSISLGLYIIESKSLILGKSRQNKMNPSFIVTKASPWLLIRFIDTGSPSQTGFIHDKSDAHWHQACVLIPTQITKFRRMLMVTLTVLKSKLCWSSEQRIKTAHSYKQKLSDAVLLFLHGITCNCFIYMVTARHTCTLHYRDM